MDTVTAYRTKEVSKRGGEREGERVNGKRSKTPGDILNVAQKNDYRLSHCNHRQQMEEGRKGEGAR